MVKQNQGRIFQAGILIGIILLVLNSIEGWLFSGLYANSDPALWQKMSGNWWLQILIFNLVVGLILALVYSVMYKGIPDKGLGKGIQYGFWIWLVGTVPGLLITMLTMTVPAELVVVWIITGLINLLIAGMILSSLIKIKE
ncbi:hypothetical protein KJ840_04595 [Patescibacteria group bacterium]|nr:hypothetical protein [Patescibacteria group bacterium]